MLGVFGSCLKMAKFEPTTPNTTQHFATGWPNARNMLRPTMLRYVALACCDRLTGALQSIKSFRSRAIGLNTSRDRISPNFVNCARCVKDLKDNKHDSLHLGPEYGRIFVLGHYLFLEAHSSQLTKILAYFRAKWRLLFSVYPTSASGIIVLLKTPPIYRKLDYNKNKKAQESRIRSPFLLQRGSTAGSVCGTTCPKI